MNLSSNLLIGVTVAFALLTGVALADVGYFGIIEPHFRSWGAAQVLVDLVILGLLACVWMVADSRSSGIAAWPFVLVTIFLGSFGPLLYLIVRARKAPALSLAAGAA